MLDKVIGYVHRLVAYLQRAYHSEDGCQEMFFFSMQGPGELLSQPFQKDTQQDYQAETYEAALRRTVISVEDIAEGRDQEPDERPDLNALQRLVIDRLGHLLLLLPQWQALVVPFLRTLGTPLCL